MSVVFLLQCLSTFAMTGLIWFVQVVHYPLFASVGDDRFVEYEQQHRGRTSLVVGPLMLTEAMTATVLLWSPDDISSGIAAFGFGLVLLIWISTALLQVPEHNRLSEGYDAGASRRLVLGNWIRTASWTTRSVLLLVVMAGAPTA